MSMRRLKYSFVFIVYRFVSFDRTLGTREILGHLPPVFDVLTIRKVDFRVVSDIGFPFGYAHAPHPVYKSLGPVHGFPRLG